MEDVLAEYRTQAAAQESHQVVVESFVISSTRLHVHEETPVSPVTHPLGFQRRHFPVVTEAVGGMDLLGIEDRARQCSRIVNCGLSTLIWAQCHRKFQFIGNA